MVYFLSQSYKMTFIDDISIVHGKMQTLCSPFSSGERINEVIITISISMYFKILFPGVLQHLKCNLWQEIGMFTDSYYAKKIWSSLINTRYILVCAFCNIVRLFVCFVCLFVWFVCLFICLFVCLVCLFVYLFVFCLFVCLILNC